MLLVLPIHLPMLPNMRSFKEVVDDLEKDPHGEDAQIFYQMVRLLRPEWRDLTDAQLMNKAKAMRDSGGN